MFDICFSVADKLNGGYKKTICRIYRIYDENHKDLISMETAYWNNQTDYYDLRIGKKEALKKAYNLLSDSTRNEFDDWLEKL